ncbi:MAG: hypothetical protein NTV57_18300 [Cyanobacteria bacterium]|nr:hypothetical protein [Cyanobacteriota bacterium]
MVDPQQAQPDSSVRIEELAELVCQQAEAIQGLKAQLSKQITREIANSTQQLEAHQALQALIGDVSAPLHGWLISPDFALLLVRLIRDNQYDLIIEFGSGTSTLLSLRALERFAPLPSADDASLHRLLSFELLEAYHQKTADLVMSCKNRALLDLRLSELLPWADATGSYSHYSGTAAIESAIQSVHALLGHPLKLLVVIDGPPGATCHWARYPAMSIVLDAASGMDLSIDFLLDDMIRPDEQELALAWEQQLKSFGLSYQRVDYNFEKGGLLLSLKGLDGIDTSFVRSDQLAAEKSEQEAVAAAIARVDELLSELETAKRSSAQALQQSQAIRDEQAARVKVLERELAKSRGERDAAVKEKVAAQQSAADLKQQLTTQRDALQQAEKARDDYANRLKDLNVELAKFKTERGAAVAGLQRLRHLAQPAGTTRL